MMYEQDKILFYRDLSNNAERCTIYRILSIYFVEKKKNKSKIYV